MSLVRERIMRDTALYAAANYTAMAIGIAVSLATKAILGPLGAGYWALMKVFQSYGEYADMGTRDALLREVPQAQGAGDHERVVRMQRSAFAFTLVAACVAAIVILISARFVRDPQLAGGLWLIAALVVATHLYNFFLNSLRMLKKISVLSFVVIANILLVAACSLWGAWVGGVKGLAGGLLVSTFLSAGLACKLSRIAPLPQWNSAEIGRLIRIGLPMVALSYVLITFLSIDTVMIGRMIGVSALGAYTIALMSVQQVNALGRFTQIVIFPHVQERYGRTRSIQDSAAYFTKTTDALAHVLPVIIGSVMFLVPVVVYYFLPKFASGIVAMKILTAGYFFVAVNEMSSSILYTIDRQWRLIPVYTAMAVLAAGINFVFIRSGWGIEGVASATAITYFIFFLFVFSLSFREILTPRQLWKKIFSICIIFVYFATCAWLVGQWRPSLPFWMASCAQYGLFLLTQAPLLLRLERRENVLGTIFRSLRKTRSVGAEG